MPNPKLPVQAGDPPVRAIDPQADAIATIDRRVARRARYAQEPHAVMIVVSVNTGAGTMKLRRPKDAHHNGKDWPWIETGTTYTAGDRVIVSLDPSLPHVVGKLSST